MIWVAKARANNANGRLVDQGLALPTIRQTMLIWMVRVLFAGNWVTMPMSVGPRDYAMHASNRGTSNATALCTVTSNCSVVDCLLVMDGN